MTKKDKVEKVMHEWKTGTLTSHGKKVTDYDQAVAIALSEAGLSKYARGGGVGLDNFDALDLPISYRLINNKGEVIFKTNSFNKASDTRTIKGFEGEGKLKIIATDKSGNQKIIADGIDEDGKKYEKGGNMNKYAKGGAVDAPKIYVADLEAYNNGKLVGEWLDLSDFEDGKDVSKEISKLLKKWGAEEYAIHDVENVPSSIYSEYMGEEDFDKIIKIYKASEENDLPYEVISEIILQYEPKDLEEWISDHYEGHFDNDTDLAYSVVENMGGVSDLGEKTTEMYFDYEGFGRDLAINDEWEGDFDSDEDRGYDYVENMGGVSELGDKTIDMYFDYDKFGRDLAINDYTEIEDGYYFRSPRYAKGGLTNERRYVNKSQNYEVRYAKNRLKRTGYKNERKFAVGGEIGNTVSFKGDYGTPRSGVVKEKRGSSYIVATDDGDRLVDSYEVISFSETPIAKKKRFGFFAGGGSIESKKQAILDFINSFPDKPKNWSEATDDLPELHHDIAEQYGSKYDFDFNKRSSLRDRNLRHKQHSKSLLNKLSDEEISDVYSKWEETLEDKFAGGGEIENKIEKLKKVVSSKMLPESVKAKAQAEIDKLEKELHESKETKAEEKEEHKAGGSEYKSKLEKDLEKELNRLQRDLNSFRLQIYTEGDDSEKEKARQRERTSKIIRMNEVLALLNEIEIGKENKMTGESEGERNVGMDEEEDYIEAKTKALEKSLKDKTISETQRKRDEKELALFKGAEAKKPTTRAKFKVGETVNFNNELYKILEIKKAKDLDGEGDATWRYLLDGYGDIMIQEDLLKEYKAPSKPTTRKPTTRKAPVKKAVVKKTEVKKDLPKIKVGDTIKVYATNGDLIIDEIYNNDKGEVSYRGKYIQNSNLKSYYSSKKVYDYILNEKDIIAKTPAKPKADHKKLVAKLKAKKGDKEYDNRASLVPFTETRRKRNESSDRKRSALPPGKRVSENGVTYYENRLNRTDLSKKDKFEKGGEVKGSDWSLNLNW